jgi:uncharacterized damage-inducible protein DinB
MKLTELFQSQLDAEVGRTRRALERTPEGQDDWRPHEKSMPLGRLAMLVASMPSWVPLIINQDELDVRPAGRPNVDSHPIYTRSALLQALDQGLAQARSALAQTSDEHLLEPWRLLAGGRTVNEEPRYVVLRDTFAHLAHHRGQLTVYLRLNNVLVPAIYGPSADDARFD